MNDDAPVMKLDGKAALVTGSSRGIGAAIATLFARQGARVAVHGRDQAALDGVCGRIVAAGGRALVVTAGVTRISSAASRRPTPCPWSRTRSPTRSTSRRTTPAG